MQDINDLVPKSAIAKEMITIRKNNSKLILMSIICVFVSGMVGMSSKWILSVFVALYAAAMAFIMVPNQREILRLEEKYNLGEVIDVRSRK